MIVNALQAIFAFILVLAPLVFIHELGHFLAAKALRIGVPVFSLGFGPRLFGFRRAETDYRVSLVPLGGYVRLAGDEADENRTGAPEEFLSRPKWQRFVVFVAGAAFNLVLAYLGMWLYFGLYGKQEMPLSYPVVTEITQGSTAEESGVLPGDRILTLGGKDLKSAPLMDIYLYEITLAPDAVKPLIVEREGERFELELQTGSKPKTGIGDPGWTLSVSDTAPAVVRQVVEGEPAEAAGLLAGDRIVGADGRKPISETDLRFLLASSPEQEIQLEIEREGRLISLSITPRRQNERGFIGVDFNRRKLSVGEAAVESWRANLALSKTLFVVLKRLVTREVSLRAMSGPIGIAQVARQALVAGPEMFLYLLGFFSLQLGILNLLPIPVLDGGHILILLVEGVMRRDLSERVKERVMQVGFVFLLAFMGVIIYLDVVKSF